MKKFCFNIFFKKEWIGFFREMECDEAMDIADLISKLKGECIEGEEKDEEYTQYFIRRLNSIAYFENGLPVKN